jgi:hypothetical protein
MISRRLGIAAVVVVGLGSIGVGLPADQGPGDARRAGPAVPRSDAARLSPGAAAIYKYVTMRKPDELKWQRIPWLDDLPEAVRQARAENRPILLWATVDDPLERC